MENFVPPAAWNVRPNDAQHRFGGVRRRELEVAGGKVHGGELAPHGQRTLGALIRGCRLTQRCYGRYTSVQYQWR